MAPVETSHPAMGFSSLEVGVVSLVVFFILCIVLVTLCIKCQRKSGNAYDVSGTTQQNDGAGGPNGAVGTKSGEDLDSSLTWRSHKTMPNMPPNSQDPSRAATK